MMRKFKIHSDEELSQKENNDNYLMRKIIKWVLVVVFCLLVVILVVSLVIEFFKNPNLHDAILTKLSDNITTFIVFALSIIGFKQIKN